MSPSSHSTRSPDAIVEDRLAGGRLADPREQLVATALRLVRHGEHRLVEAHEQRGSERVDVGAVEGADEHLASRNVCRHLLDGGVRAGPLRDHEHGIADSVGLRRKAQRHDADQETSPGHRDA